MIIAVLLGLLSGAHAATWGAYKDSPYEGYRPGRQARSVLIAVAVGAVLAGTGVIGRANAIVVLGMVYAVERLTTEWWKAILREDDQSAYSIPMRLGLFGRPVERAPVRYAVGGLVVTGVVVAALALHAAQTALEPLPWWLLVSTVGGVGGWLTAVGGAWKDAPVEGFSFWKFLRSPAVAIAWAVPLSALTRDWVALALAASGLAVVVIETYKTFLTGGRPPGKFATRPVRFQVSTVRYLSGVVHASVWCVGAVALALQLATTPGLVQLTASGPKDMGAVAEVGVLILALTMAMLVVRANGAIASIHVPAPPGAARGSEPLARERQAA